MNGKLEFLIDTDLLIQHLIHQDKNEASYLEIAMTLGLCFTTVLNAAELYFSITNPVKKQFADDLLKSLKVLGLHARYSLNISEFFNKVASTRDALMCSAAKNNKLMILTLDEKRYRKSEIKIINPKELRGMFDTR